MHHRNARSAPISAMKMFHLTHCLESRCRIKCTVRHFFLSFRFWFYCLHMILCTTTILAPCLLDILPHPMLVSYGKDLHIMWSTYESCFFFFIWLCKTPTCISKWKPVMRATLLNLAFGELLRYKLLRVWGLVERRSFLYQKKIWQLHHMVTE